MKGETFQIQSKKPFSFELYPKLFFRDQIRLLPFEYTRSYWRGLISAGGKNIPLLVRPSTKVGGTRLTVTTMDLSTSERKDVTDLIKRVFNTDMDLSLFYRKTRGDVKLHNTIKQLEGLRPYISANPYESLIKAVIRQLINAQAAVKTISNLVERLGTHRIINDMSFYGFPSAGKLAKASKQELLRCGVGYKWKLIRKLASDIHSGDLDLAELESKFDDYVISRLREYKGIGAWTAKIFLYDGLGRLDSYPMDDISIVKAIASLYYKRGWVTLEKIIHFFSKYSNFRGIVISYLFGYLWLKRLGI